MAREVAVGDSPSFLRRLISIGEEEPRKDLGPRVVVEGVELAIVEGPGPGVALSIALLESLAVPSLIDCPLETVDRGPEVTLGVDRGGVLAWNLDPPVLGGKGGDLGVLSGG